MPGCSVSLTTESFCSVVNRRRRATPVMTSTFENVSDIGVCLGLCLAPPANAGVRSKRGAVHHTGDRRHQFDPQNARELADAEKRFTELTGLGFTAAERTTTGETRKVTSFDPTAQETVFFPRLVGG